MKQVAEPGHESHLFWRAAHHWVHMAWQGLRCSAVLWLHVVGRQVVAFGRAAGSWPSHALSLRWVCLTQQLSAMQHAVDDSISEYKPEQCDSPATAEAVVSKLRASSWLPCQDANDC